MTKRKYDIFNLPEVMNPTIIVKEVYSKKDHTLTVYVPKLAYGQLIKDCATYGTVSDADWSKWNQGKNHYPKLSHKGEQAFADTYVLLSALTEGGIDQVLEKDLAKVIRTSTDTMTIILRKLEVTRLIYTDNSQRKKDVKDWKVGKNVMFHPNTYSVVYVPFGHIKPYEYDRDKPSRDSRLQPLKFLNIPESWEPAFISFSSLLTQKYIEEMGNIKSCDLGMEYDNIEILNPEDEKHSILQNSNLENSGGAPDGSGAPAPSTPTPALASINAPISLMQNIDTQLVNTENLYISPYQELTLDFKELKKLDKFFHIPFRIRNGIIKWARNFKKRPIVTNGRIYHIFHQTPHELREYLLYKGSHLVEAFDLHNAFYSLMLFALKDNVPESEYKKYRELVKTGKFYEDVRDKAGLSDRSEAKELLQRYRNCTIPQIESKSKDDPRLGKVDEYFQKEFPEIRAWLGNYRRSNGVKKLQADMCFVELSIFNPICRMLNEKIGVTPFSLHDGIYLSEAENEFISDKVDWDQIQDEYIWSKV